MRLSTAIQHIIVIPKETEYKTPTTFQGFSSDLVIVYHWIFSGLTFFPHDILECSLKGLDLVKFKNIIGNLDVFLIREDLLNSKYLNFDGFFNILWSTQLTWKSTESVVSKFTHRPIHISSFDDKASIYYKNLDETKIFKMLNAQILTAKNNNEFKKTHDHLISKFSFNHSCSVHEFQSINHPCIKPLVNSLTKIGLADNVETLKTFDKNIYIDSIINLTKLMDKIRIEAGLDDFTINNDAILYAPSIFAHLYNMNSWKSQLRNSTKFQRDFIREILIRNRGYSNAQINSKEGLKNPYEDDLLYPLLSQRQFELKFFTEIVSTIAVNQFCPAIRLSNEVMLNHHILLGISNLIKGTNSKIKLNKMFVKYSNKLKENISIKLLDVAISKKNRVFAICDFPIEWINLEGLPIMFTHEISRVPSTPGNLLIQMGLGGQKVQLPYESLTKILIIKSFDKDDPIRNHISDKIQKYKDLGEYDNLKIEIIDVLDENELHDALSKFNGAIVIFDCHGGHGGYEKESWLMIGNDKVSFNNSIYKSKIPPIVLLSACSTHPIDGSHASVANSLFSNGALSVLGTYAPISSNHASTFITRILHRVSKYVPLITCSSPISWRRIISDFFKMSYCRDVLTLFMDELKILSPENYRKIHIKLNLYINTSSIEWNNQLKLMLQAECQLSNDELDDIFMNKLQFVDSMLYTQLGRPENIVIFK
mgnify:CR=1 FL=1